VRIRIIDGTGDRVRSRIASLAARRDEVRAALAAEDIAGGRDDGFDPCWFNPARRPRPADVEPTYEIARLRELLEIVPDGTAW
jgi:2-haloacid dehalogenase